MATPAAAASAVTIRSSAVLNPSAPRLSVRYRLPNTCPRTFTGTPRKDFITGWPGGNPTAEGWLDMSSRRIGTGWFTTSPRIPRPRGRSPIAAWAAWSIPTWTNSVSCPSGPSTPSAP